jgi:agmatine/peptidylarginine deiminase
MITEIIIGVVSSLIATALVVMFGKYLKRNELKRFSIKDLMKKLVDVKANYTRDGQQKILMEINKKLGNNLIKKTYIQNFKLNNRRVEELFLDICVQNDIEPTNKICTYFLGNDSPSKREEYYKIKEGQKPTEQVTAKTEEVSDLAPSLGNKGQTVYMSELLMSQYPETCKRLIAILEKHHVNYSWIKGTKDIWCRDYMPVQTESGKFIQFTYDPSYLKGKKEWEESRSDVKEVCKLNGIDATYSDINLDGGNVLICSKRAIISDRVYSENPNYPKDELEQKLSELLDCEIIIIPALKSQDEDLTGHADGMVRFVDRNTIIGNERLPNEYKYMKEGLQKAIDTYNLTYIDIPFFVDKDPIHPSSAVGIYVNYLEVNDLIVVPIFKHEKDKKAVDIIQKAFPNKIIETINYDDVAKEGGLLNCTTWVVTDK